MSVGSDDAFPIASLCPNDETAPSSFDWLLSMLQQAMTEVMASDAAPLQKASALARLGALYLRAYRAAGLEQANKELARRIKALEPRLEAAEAAAAMAQVCGGQSG